MSRKNMGTFRGLDTLFLENTEESVEKNAKRTIRIALIEPKTGQPRKTFLEEPLEQLAASIATYGVLQPILVRELPNGKYQIVAGERRWRASKLAGLSEIPAIVLEGDEKEAAEIALVENIQREDLNPVEEALAYRSLSEEYGMTQEEIAGKIGKSRSAIANAERLLDLPDELLSLLANRTLTAGHARALLSLKSKEDRIALANRAIEEGWSVRAAEEEVKRFLRKQRAAEKEALTPATSFAVDYAEVLETRLLQKLGRRCKLSAKGKHKSITFFYENNEDLDDFLRLLCGNEFVDGE